LALISGSPLQGGLIMLAFALGTLPSLFAIGASSTSLVQQPRFADKFSQVAGLLVLFFALYNINSQLNVLGLPSLSDLRPRATKNAQIIRTSDQGLAPLVDGKQVLNMEASAKVRAGVPVRWVIKDTGTSGCTNAIISRDLFAGEISLIPGETNYKEFTPSTPGRYKFSCWMGMISGVIEVVDPTS